MFRSMDFCAVICVMAIAAPISTARPAAPFFQEKWNGTFHRRAIESGDTLAIGAVFCNGSEVFIYDEAGGAVAVLDSAGKLVSVSKLEAAARGAYYGDDFAELEGRFIFLNSVDKRLDYFDRYSGKRLASAALPPDALAGERKRSFRVVNRIFIIGGKIFIGNGYRLFGYDGKLKKKVSEATILKAPDRDRFALFSPEKKYVERDGFIVAAGSPTKTAIPPTHFTINGKRFFVLRGRLYAVCAAREELRIIELK